MAPNQPKNPLDDRRKAQEAEYFRKQNTEASARIKCKAELEKFGIHDEKLTTELTAAGFNADKARALFVVPLVEVGWADGKIQTEERVQIKKLMEARSIEEGSEAYTLVMSWLENKPTDVAFSKAKDLLWPIVEEFKKSHNDMSQWLLESSIKVAEATGGLFGIGFNMISKEESELIKQISEKISS